ncbi:MAG TPA: hypothetical protein VG167_11655 [Verrucomicrobiae bacterium]|nr:hypothetical protein [Verrucomicrobiae bacterium]
MNKSANTGVFKVKMMMNSERLLAKGQVWKTRVADIEIMDLGRKLIRYRITKQLGHRRFSMQISGIQALENYLKANAARLVHGTSNN